MRKTLATAAFTALLLCLTPPSAGEMSIHDRPTGPQLIHIFGKQSDPDPLPHFGLVLQTPLNRALNPNGDAAGDKRSDLAYALGARPSVVWMHWDGVDYEIAFSEWDGTAWTAPLLLTGNAVDDTDPKIALAASGEPVVTWWRDAAPEEVFATRRQAGGGWETESRVSQGPAPATAPTVAVGPDGRSRFAHEADAGPLREIVITRDDRAVPSGPPAYVPEVVAATSYAGPTAPIVESHDGRVWATWIDGPGLIGWSELDGGSWTAPSYEPYAGEGDVEPARFRIRRAILR